MSTKSLHVGNLPYDVTKDDLRALFAEFGPVAAARVIEGRGIGFVDLPEENATEAMAAVNGRKFRGRALRVNEARPRRGQSDRGRDVGDPGATVSSLRDPDGCGGDGKMRTILGGLRALAIAYFAWAGLAVVGMIARLLASSDTAKHPGQLIGYYSGVALGAVTVGVLLLALRRVLDLWETRSRE